MEEVHVCVPAGTQTVDPEAALVMAVLTDVRSAPVAVTVHPPLGGGGGGGATVRVKLLGEPESNTALAGLVPSMPYRYIECDTPFRYWDGMVYSIP